MFRLVIVFIVSLFSNITCIYSQCNSGNCQDGFGVKLYPDKGRFEGTFEKGLRKNGKYFYPTGDIYEGTFEKNLRQGYGTYIYRTGQVFKGIYKNDEKEFGLFKYLNGDEYTGTFSNNLPDGFGVMRLANGKSLEGIWVNGNIDWKASTDSLNFIGQIDTVVKSISADLSEKAVAPRMFAVVVGISDYEGYNSDLRYSDDDAKIFFNHLKRAFSKEISAGEAVLLTDSRANKAAILSSLKNTFSKASENDYIIFFFSGHGGKGSFVPYDLSINTLEHEEVKRVFKESNAKYKLCIADACFSGSIGSENIQVANYDASQNLRDARLAVLLSSSDQQTSMEMGNLGQGLFSFWLMNGLRGAADLNHDNYVTAGELFVYTRKAVVSQSGGRQIPVIIGQQLDRIPLCRLRQ